MPQAPRPIYLTSEHGSLFAWYYQGGGTETPTGLGVVLCRPMGSELMCSYRAMRELALALSRAGIAVLAIDYHGTGDSDGGDEDPRRVEAWLGSIDRAIDALRAQGAAAVGVVGVRIGATLAAIVASRRGDVASAVLWAPCRTGKAYAREMKMLALSEAPADVATDSGHGDVEAGGFLLTAESIADLSSLDLTKLSRPPAPNLLVIARDDMAADDPLAAALGGVSVQWPGYAGMMLVPHRSVAPMDTFVRIGAWLAALPIAKGGTAAAVDDSSQAVEFGGVRERPITFGRLGGPSSEERMFGVLCEPVGGTRAKTALLLPNMGANYHIGPNRMYVRMARAWAARGYSVLRFDVSGIGDSGLRPGKLPNVPYSSYGVDDLEIGLAELRGRSGVSRFAVVGLCSGAYVAFHASLRGSALDAQILVNPQAFYWKDGDSLDSAPSTTIEGVKHYQSAAQNWSSWQKLLTGKAQYRALAKTLARRARDVGETRLKRLAGRLGVIKLAEDLGRDLRAIAERGVTTLLVYSANDAGIVYLHARAGHELDRLIRGGRLKIEMIDGADHTFTRQASQRALVDLTTSYLVRELP